MHANRGPSAAPSSATRGHQQNVTWLAVDLWAFREIKQMEMVADLERRLRRASLSELRHRGSVQFLDWIGSSLGGFDGIRGSLRSVERPGLSMGRVSFALPLKALIGLHLCWSSQVCGTCMDGPSRGVTS